MTQTPPAIEFRNLRKVYQTRGERRVALEGLNLVVPAGEIYGFAGPNGAGKSTSIKILVGLTQASSGSARVFGHKAGTRAARELVGFLPEVTLYHEFMGAEELLAVHARLSGMSRADRKERIPEVLQTVGLWERRASRLKEFSKGMKQRFGIAQAILTRPKLLVLDELTSGLDPQAQANLLSLLETLKAEGLTIFFSSHHLSEIEKICDSVAIVHLGVLRCHGPLHSVLGEGEWCRLTVRFPDQPSQGLTWVRQDNGSFVGRLSRAEISTALESVRQAGGEVVELRDERDSLESLFHRLTTESEAKIS